MAAVEFKQKNSHPATKRNQSRYGLVLAKPRESRIIHRHYVCSGAESYEELESRGQRIRQILDSTDSFQSDTPTNALHKGEAGGGWRGGGGDALSSVSQEGRVMVAFTLKEVGVAIDRLPVAVKKAQNE